MRNIVFALAAFAAAGMSSAPAVASSCAVDEYTHNNSLMELQVCDGGDLSISYVRPRQGMMQEGVRSGTLLLNGRWLADNDISGTARLFSRRCGEITYQVSGWKQGTTITLSGQAPVRGNNCQVVRWRHDDLVFVLSGGRAAGGASN